jgi:phytoene/squalene synthetase
MQIYLRNMMKVMSFDVERCGRPITQTELNEYTRLLSSAVTELLFYLFGHQSPAPGDEHRYDAVKGAHIVHMLRDVVEDIPAGYFNIPAWLVEGVQHSPDHLHQLHQLPFRRWVYGRVGLARRYFANGRRYISKVKNLRCRLAGFAYLARFEWMLRKIEQDEYCLRAAYPERKGPTAATWILWRILTSSLRIPGMITERAKQAPLTDLLEDR